VRGTGGMLEDQDKCERNRRNMIEMGRNMAETGGIRKE